ncbi:MAG TPA: amidohydrolase family protein [Spirochaetota bacterium]|nr:amidohydrolase family protein [Spirochaetota bacterium]HPI90248.1 amidohydrolase family protein [Spirochaetota bacterium]HPR46511.1 amidohydrolase family protein [Spirochaetota bacterium]
MKKWIISGVDILNPEAHQKKKNVTIEKDTILTIGRAEGNDSVELRIDDGILTPGLINSHDHLLGNYFPKVGNGPYENWLPWDNDLKSAPVYQERQQIENRDLYLLGGYRNLVSGVTTVSDHIPHFVAEPYYDLLPTKAIREYALAHSITSFALAWGDGISVEYQKAVKEGIPFVTHIAEGFDAETRKDVVTLDKQGGLGDHSVLVHGLSFSDSDMDLIKQRGASVVWCGDSNYFMYSKTANVNMLRKKGVNVCIGTDSPMSGGLNILHEMKFDKSLYKKLFGGELPDEEIVKMVTVNPAKAFWLKNHGMVREGYHADLTVFRNRGGSAASSVVSAELKDVLLVVIDGLPVYGEAAYAPVFKSLGVKYQEIVIDGVERIIIGDVIGLLKRISRAVGFKKEFPFLPVEFEV